MKDFNFEFFKHEVGTQYNDMGGLVAIDGHNAIADIEQLCRDHEVDLENYDFVGLTFFDGETIGRYDVSLAALLTKKDESPDENGQTHIYKKYFRIPYQELGNYIKRLSFGVALPGTAGRIQNPVFEELND